MRTDHIALDGVVNTTPFLVENAVARIDHEGLANTSAKVIAPHVVRASTRNTAFTAQTFAAAMERATHGKAIHVNDDPIYVDLLLD